MDTDTRIRLLEGDVDSVHDLFRELKAEMHDGFAQCTEDSDGLRKLLTGLLIAIVTTSITIVATVLITTGGGAT